jgi:hypothetical protein
VGGGECGHRYAGLIFIPLEWDCQLHYAVFVADKLQPSFSRDRLNQRGQQVLIAGWLIRTASQQLARLPVPQGEIYAKTRLQIGTELLRNGIQTGPARLMILPAASGEGR